MQGEYTALHLLHLPYSQLSLGGIYPLFLLRLRFRLDDTVHEDFWGLLPHVPSGLIGRIGARM